MTDELAQPIPDEFVQQARDALLHYYDYAYLARHPLLAHLRHPAEDPTVAVMELRRLLLTAVQQLRPAASVPPEHPAWRPYRVLHERCILGKDWAQVEAELSLSKRQLQREQQDGFAAAALALWRMHRVSQPPASSEGPAADALMQEINRTTPERTTFDASEQLSRALAAAQTLAARYGVTLAEHGPDSGILAAGNPLVFRQIVLSLASLMMRSGVVRTLVVRLERQGEKVLCALLASLNDPTEEAPPHEELPDALLTLAASQKAEIRQSFEAGRWRLQVAWLPAEKAPVIALVEDNRDLVALLTRYLTSHGYRLVEVSPGPEVFARLIQIQPDAILLDIMMRDVDGWEILQRIKSDARLRHVPVAVCSVLDEPDLAACLGADAYLHKPIRPAQFLECLGTLLERPAHSAAASSG